MPPRSLLAKPPSDQLLSTLAAIAPTYDPNHTILPFLLVEPTQRPYPSPSPFIPSQTVRATPNPPKQRKRNFPEYYAAKSTAVVRSPDVPPYFHTLSDGSWVASDCWEFHGRQSCVSTSTSTDPATSTLHNNALDQSPSTTTTTTTTTTTPSSIDMSSLPKGWQPRDPRTKLYPIPIIIAISIILSGLIVGAIWFLGASRKRKRDGLCLTDPELKGDALDKLFQRIKKKSKKRRKLKEKRLDDDEDDGDVPPLQDAVTGESSAVAAPSKKKGLRERLKRVSKSSRLLVRTRSRHSSTTQLPRTSQPHEAPAGDLRYSVNSATSSNPSNRQPPPPTPVPAESGDVPSPSAHSPPALPHVPPPSITRSPSSRTSSSNRRSLPSSPLLLAPSTSAQPRHSPPQTPISLTVPEPIYSSQNPSSLLPVPPDPPAYRRHGRSSPSNSSRYVAFDDDAPQLPDQDDFDLGSDLERPVGENGNELSPSSSHLQWNNRSEGHIATDDKRLLERMHAIGRSEPPLSPAAASSSSLDQVSSASGLSSSGFGMQGEHGGIAVAPALDEIEEREMEVVRGERSPAQFVGPPPPGGRGIKVKDDFFLGMTNREEESGGEQLPGWSASSSAVEVRPGLSSSMVLPPPPPLHVFPIPPPAPIVPSLPHLDEDEDGALHRALGLVGRADPGVDGLALPAYQQMSALPPVLLQPRSRTDGQDDDDRILPSAPPVEDESAMIMVPSAPPEEEFEGGGGGEGMSVASAPPAPEEEFEGEDQHRQTV